MNGSPPPRPAAVAVLVVLIVELPAFILFLIMRLTPNYGPEWRIWPVLPGLFPVAFLTDKLNLLPRHFGLVQLGVFTVLFMTLLFLVSWRTRFWRMILTVGLAGSSALAVLGLLMLRA